MQHSGALTTEAVQGLALALERVDDVHGGDGLAAGVLAVGDGVTDHVLKEDLEDGAGLLVDEARDALDSAPASKAADRGLGDALDVVAQHLAVALGAALSESLSSLSASCGGGEGVVAGGGEERLLEKRSAEECSVEGEEKERDKAYSTNTTRQAANAVLKTANE